MSFILRIKKSFTSVFSFFTSSWTELSKVKWPTRKEMISYTLVVIGTVTFVTIYFYLLDKGITQLLRLVFN